MSSSDAVAPQLLGQFELGPVAIEQLYSLIAVGRLRLTEPRQIVARVFAGTESEEE